MKMTPDTDTDTESSAQSSASTASRPPVVTRDAVTGAPDQAALVECVNWFLNFDSRVAIVRHPHVEQVFQWKQTRDETITPSANAFHFDSVEDRFALGVFQALATYTTEADLHRWISELLTALDDATKTNEAITEAFALSTDANVAALERAARLPSDDEREIFLTTCWLEVLCTAEARVLGWLYQDLYNRAFHPNNF
ncbi:MAG: hypothetical protein MSG64_19360 [Pyrinomonadaceae bacterium MAG19_C2-C3]|nr:hypothetical protein [Pyrinomonadaceae bacterium MAG19_C2-C3]